MQCNVAAMITEDASFNFSFLKFLASESGKDYYPIFFTMDFAFEEFFCICIQLLNKTWKEMRATSGDFNRVMQVVKDQICRALREKHQSMEMFKVCITKQRRFVKPSFHNISHEGAADSRHAFQSAEMSNSTRVGSQSGKAEFSDKNLSQQV